MLIAMPDKDAMGATSPISELIPPVKEPAPQSMLEEDIKIPVALPTTAVEPFEQAAPEAALATSAPLSRRQQKKQIQRDAIKGRKGQKKIQKQSDACDAAVREIEESLSLAWAGESHADLGSLLVSLFNIEQRYEDLLPVFGPDADEGCAVLESIVLRNPKYNAKFLPQEYSLLHKIWAVLGEDTAGAGVVDIGAGNANCAVFAAALLGLTVICVERESPREELRAELLLPPEFQRRVIRVESDIEDFTTETLRDLAKKHGLDRIVLTAKHPCGIGVDRSIQFAARLHAEAQQKVLSEPGIRLVDIIGVVIAICCTNKLSCDDNKVSRVGEFCSLYSSSGLEPFQGASLERGVETMSRCCAWRTTAQSLGNAILPKQERWSELFEDAVQSVRLRKLRLAFGSSAQVRFAPRSCTLQDRCLIASRLISAGAVDPAVQSTSFISMLRAGAENFKRVSGGPIDCHPKGLKSAKFDFDYTDESLLAD